MKNKTGIMNMNLTKAVLIALFVFVGVGMSTHIAFAQYSYGGGDYGYTYNNTPTYSYGGGDYGYTYEPTTYSYGGGDFGYTYNNTPTYSYGGGDYGYTYEPTTYSYGGGDFGYTYNNTPTYSYGGGDYGYTYEPTTYVTPGNYVGVYDYSNGYNYVGGSTFVNGGGYNYDYGYSSPQPRCRLTVDNTRITEGGETVLRWQTWNADNVDLNQGFGSVSDIGDMIITPSVTTTYVLDVERENWIGSDDHVTCTVTVRVVPAPEPQTPRCTLRANPGTRTGAGSVTLSWNTDYTTDVRIDNGVGNVSLDGSRSVSVAADTTYTLTAEGPGGEVTCVDTVNIVPSLPSSPRCEFLTSSSYFVNAGDNVVLRWGTTNTDTVSINNSVGTVSTSGSQSVQIDQNTTYTLTAQNSSGTDTCQVSISVNTSVPPSNNTSPSCDSFTVSDDNVDPGDYVTLRWRTSDANDVSINNGVGNVSDDGTERIRVYDDTTFRLTARNNSGSDSCTVRVRVDDDDDERAPRCRLTISDTSITQGEEIRLSWNNTRTTRAILRDDAGREIFDTRDDREFDEDRDEIQLRPTRSSDYTMTVYNGSTRRTCTVGTDIESGTVAGIRFQETIALGGTPYTGFEAGPLLTTLFYIAVALWGLAIGYVLVLRKHQNNLDLKAAVITPMTESDTHSDVASDMPVDVEHSEISEVEKTESNKLVELEQAGHEQKVLFSGDALNHIYTHGVDEGDRLQKLNQVVETVKEGTPSDGDWVTVNKAQVADILG